MMESGEKEMRQVFEDVTTNNVKATVAFSNETRKLIRELENKVLLLGGQLRQANDRIDELKKLVTNLQMKIFRGGT